MSGWHHQRIIAEVRIKGSTLAELSRQHGLNRRVLQTSLYKRYPKAHRIIADFLGVPAETIWPQYYGPKAKIPGRRRAA